MLVLVPVDAPTPKWIAASSLLPGLQQVVSMSTRPWALALREVEAGSRSMKIPQAEMLTVRVGTQGHKCHHPQRL